MTAPKPRKARKLKPCPFCGTKVKISKLYGAGFKVWCHGCAVETIAYNSEAEAREAWNRRKP